MIPSASYLQAAIVSFQAKTLRILIASPSDLVEERQAATDVINDWNAQHAEAEGVIILPVRWETHATPEAGVRPQAAINRQLVQTSDILVGMFWTKLGTSTGVAESGTVEEIDQFVAAGKPTLLYFSSRPIDPNRIDLRQHEALRTFKDSTYRSALVGGFASIQELRDQLGRNLMSIVRSVRPRRRTGAAGKLEETAKLTEIMIAMKANSISADELQRFRDDILKPRNRSAAQMSDPVAPGEVGPNGHRIGYLKNGDKVEWIPDDEEGEWPMILRRNDKSIVEAEQKFFDIIWYDRKLVMFANIKENEEKQLDPAMEMRVRAAMEKVERKYGKRKIRQFYKDDFEWGMLNGKLSALRWVLGDEWDNLDT